MERLSTEVRGTYTIAAGDIIKGLAAVLHYTSDDYGMIFPYEYVQKRV